MQVALVKCEDYSETNLDQAVNRAIDLCGGLEDLIKPGMTVLLKCNLLFALEPEHGTTTHPAVVAAVIRRLLPLKVKILVGDSSSFNTGQALRVCGIQALGDKYPVQIVNFNEFTPVEIALPPGSVLEKVHIAEPAMKADIIITFPKVKAHELTAFTGAVKNNFGLIVGQEKGEIHRRLPKVNDFASCVLDIFMVKKPVLCIMDGIVTVEGTAGKGKPMKMGVLLASRNAFALDLVGGSLIGINLEDMPVAMEAQKRGYPGSKWDEVEMVGDPIDQFKVKSKKPNTIFRGFMKKYHTIFMSQTKQKIKPELCQKCGVCAKCCPMKAIHLDPYPIIDYNKCIKCFCCKEVCRYGAIEVKVPILPRMVGFK